MRTIRCSSCGGVYPSMHWAGGCVSQHALGRGVCLGGVCPGGCLPRGCLPRTHAKIHPPWTKCLSHACENIPFRNFVCGRYRSGTVNSNTVNSKFHLIRSYCEIFFYHIPNISCLKCTVNSNFHLIRSKTLLTNDFELTVPNLL